MSLIDQSRIDRPVVSQVPLLKAKIVVVSESRNVRTRSFEGIVRLKLPAIIKVVINGEVLMVVDPVVETERELIGVVRAHGNGLILIRATIRLRDVKRKQVRRDRILTGARNRASARRILQDRRPRNIWRARNRVGHGYDSGNRGMPRAASHPVRPSRT